MHTIIPIIRRQRRIMQKAMAQALNVSPSYLCKIEKGIQEPNEAFKDACASYLGLPVDEIFPDKPHKGNSKNLPGNSGNNLWSNRCEKGIKQKYLDQLIGCSPSYLSKVEKGLQKPNDRFKKKCARILKIKEADLFP